MPLSIFHSDFENIPDKNWGKKLTIVFIITFLLLSTWEFYVRSKGYEPSLDTYPGLWSMNMNKLKHIDNPIVFAGMSRSTFGIDLEPLKKEYGNRVLQLSHVGIPAMPMFDMLANDETFNGKIVLSIIEAISFLPGGPLFERSYNLLDYYKKQTPAQKFSYYIHMLLDEKLAFLCKEDLTIQSLIKMLNFALGFRDGIKLLPEPMHFGVMGRNNQIKMSIETDIIMKDPKRRARIIDIWALYFNKIIPAMPPQVIQAQYKKYKENIDKIRSRGGDVIFIRIPSSGGLRIAAKKRFPKKLFDDLVKFTNTKGIHYEDHKSLQGFVCPEESHLSAEDSTIYTKDLIKTFRDLNFSL